MAISMKWNSDSSKIWTRIANSIFYDADSYAKLATFKKKL